MPHIRMDQQIFQKIKRGGIDPLQIVEEERQRMLRSGEHSEKAPKNHLKAPLHLLRRQLGDRVLFTNDEFQLRDEVQHELAIGTQRVTERLMPVVELHVALRQQRTYQALKGLCHDGIGNISLVLIELTPCKQAAPCYQHWLQLVDDRGFADAGIPRDKDQFRNATLDDVVEGGKQGFDFPFPS